MVESMRIGEVRDAKFADRITIAVRIRRRPRGEAGAFSDRGW
jgi:hypothetical protein